MSILVNNNSRVVVQGITGSEGSFHTTQMTEYGTNVVAGVTPGKGGQKDKNDIPIFIKCLNELMDNKPHDSCYIASQQLGCKTKKLNHGSSFFVHRKSTWKPWIYASWKKNDLQEKEVALEWIYKSWSKLKRFYPNIHLAQLHNHLNSHEEEITLAFGNRMNELKTLKNIFDPQGILPPL